MNVNNVSSIHLLVPDRQLHEKVGEVLGFMIDIPENTWINYMGYLDLHSKNSKLLKTWVGIESYVLDYLEGDYL